MREKNCRKNVSRILFKDTSLIKVTINFGEMFVEKKKEEEEEGEEKFCLQGNFN